MDATELQAIGDTLMRIVTPDMTPKQLIKAARREHPDASKKDIARAAFFSIITNADQDHGKAKSRSRSLIRTTGRVQPAGTISVSATKVGAGSAHPGRSLEIAKLCPFDELAP
jgi:hypothetical protein